MKYVTIFSDASFDPTTGAAGIAFWVKDNEKTERASKGLTFTVSSSGEAECFALGTAIKYALREFSVHPGDRISIQSDSMEALELLEGKRTAKFTIIGDVLSEVEQSGVTLHTKHVKGHQGKISPRHAVNVWCDAEAKKAMRKCRNRFAGLPEE